MHSGAAIPHDAIELLPNTLWYGKLWRVEVRGSQTFTSYWNTAIEATMHHAAMMRDHPEAKLYDPVQAPVLFVFVAKEVKIIPLSEVGES